MIPDAQSHTTAIDPIPGINVAMIIPVYFLQNGIPRFLVSVIHFLSLTTHLAIICAQDIQ